MVKIRFNILLIIILLAVIASGCTGGKDITSAIKALPEIQQYMKEHPNATITVTYWSKEEVAKIEPEISQQCGKSLTPAAMYKATIIEGDLRIVSWIDAENQILICSITEGKRTQEPTLPISTPTQVTLTDRVKNLGQPVNGRSNVWALTTGLDGNIYGGTGEGGTLFVYDTNTGSLKQTGNVFEEGAVYSLATGENGLIYGGTAWNSKLFVYYPLNGSISYLGQPVANGGIICSLAVIGSNIYGSTCDGGDSKYVGSHLFVYNSVGRNFTDLGQPVEGERSSKIISGKDGKIYGGTSPNGHLFSFDPRNKSFNNIGQPVHEEATAFPLIAGKNDKIYFSLDESLYVLDPLQSKIIKLFNLSDSIPLTGEFFWSLTAGLDGNIYGGTAPNGYLFVFNTSDNSVTSAERPLGSEDRIRSLTTGLDGKIYGGTGWGAYLFSYDPYYIQQKNLSERVVSEKLIAKIDSSRIPGTLKISPDNRRVAYVAYTGNKQFVVVDGKEEKKFDGIGEGSLAFSPDSKRVAYWARVGDKAFVVVDGKEGKKYDAIGKDSLIFSPDSKRVVYVAIEGNKSVVVADEKEDKPYDGIVGSTIIFSPDSKRLAYLAKEGGKWVVVVDGKEENGISPPIFSPDSKHVAHAAQEGNKWFVVVDGKEGKKYDGIGKNSPFFSPDSKRTVYTAIEGGKWFLVVEGKEEARYDGIGEDTPVFSPDGKRIAYVAFDGSNSFVVIDGKEEKRYDNVMAPPVFSPDGKRMVYGARVGNRSFMVVDGKEEKQYDSLGFPRTPVFSPDSKRMAYIAEEGNELYHTLMVVDGKEEKKYYEFKSKPIFSPDSKRIAYAAQLGDLGGVVVVDGKEEKKYTLVLNPKFSSDSKTVAYIAGNFTNFTGFENAVEVAYFLVANGKEGKKYYQKDRNIYDIIISMDQPGGGFTFDSADSLHYLVLKENGIYLVEEQHIPEIFDFVTNLIGENITIK